MKCVQAFCTILFLSVALIGIGVIDIVVGVHWLDPGIQSSDTFEIAVGGSIIGLSNLIIIVVLIIILRRIHKKFHPERDFEMHRAGRVDLD